MIQTLPEGYRMRHEFDWLQAWMQATVSIATATVNRCQPGLAEPKEWAAEVVGLSGTLISEMQYASGHRRRPPTPEEVRAMIDSLSKPYSVSESEVRK